MKKGKKIVIANWKMNPPTLAEAKKLFAGIKKTTGRSAGVQTIICPPFVYLTELSKNYSGSKIAFGGQNVFWESGGARTGEISPPMLKSTGAEFVIIGHSERRVQGEDFKIVHKKVRAALKEGFRVVLCIGERERDQEATYLSFIKEELESALSGVSSKMLSRVIIAYEPIWAIGKAAKGAMEPQELHEMTIFIKKILTEKYGRVHALKVPILYGGSAEPANVEALITKGMADGFLVGRASLQADSFGFIVKNSKYVLNMATLSWA